MINIASTLMFLVLMAPAPSDGNATTTQCVLPMDDLAPQDCVQSSSLFQLATSRSHPDYYRLGMNYLKESDYEPAIRNFDEAIRIRSGDAFAYGSRGMAHHALGHIDQAIRDFDQAIRLNPEMYWVFNNRGDSYHKKGQYDRAIEDFDEAIRLKPDFAIAFYNRGLVYAHKRKFDRAMSDLNYALRFKPNYARAYNALAWLLATIPDGQLRDGRVAVVFAQKAVQLEGRPTNHNTLAAAYAEIGDFDNAVAAQLRAIEILQSEDEPDAISAYQSRLDLYRRRQPYRE